MSLRSASVLTVISLAALTATACSPKLAPSRDAPNPPVSGPPLRVDVVDPVDPPDVTPTTPVPAETAATEAGAEAPAAPTPTPPEPEPIPVVHVEPEAEEAEPAPEPEMVRAGATHCHADERTLYNCPFEDGRVVSVCAGDEIAYRFGRLGDLELDLTRDLDGEGVRFNTARRRGEGGQTHVRFANGAYDYVVYSGRTGRRGGGSEASGVVVLHDRDEIRRLECPVASAQTAIPAAALRDSLRRERREGRYDTWW